MKNVLIHLVLALSFILHFTNGGIANDIQTTVNGGHDDRAMQVVVVRSNEIGCEPICPEWIQAQGDILSSAPAQFKKVLTQVGEKKLPIFIDSQGGSIPHALEIGRMIRARGLTVVVGQTKYSSCQPNDEKCKLPAQAKLKYRGALELYGGYCNSACGLILAGGVQRIASTTQIGIHQPSTTWFQRRGRKTVVTKITFGHNKKLKKEVTGFFNEMGVDPKLIEEMDKTANSDMRYITMGEAKGFGLITSYTSTAVFISGFKCKGKENSANCVQDQSAAEVNALINAPSDKNPKANEPPGNETIPNQGAMTFEVVRNSKPTCEPRCPEWIYAQGKIEKNSLDRLIDLLRKFPGKRPLVIDSEGGDLVGALSLGQYVHSEGITVAVNRMRFADCLANETCSLSDKKRGYAFFKPSESSLCEMECYFVLVAGTHSLWHQGGVTIARPPLIDKKYPNDIATIERFLSLYSSKKNLLRKFRPGHFSGDATDKEGLYNSDILTTFAGIDEIISPKKCRKKTTLASCITRKK